ncbi:MAG TPA: pitrilysin family protein [Blastocatellia bacterium]|nr:pitrilysin family protein [Blastocatellia bacterium]
MRRFKISILALSIITLISTLLPGAARSQSGRGRPRVPTPNADTAPQPVNVPASAVVVKQEQVGTTSRFVLQNGMTVIINEQHATPIVALAACFKTGALDEPEGMTGVARLTQRMILRGARGGKAPADMRAIGALIDADATYDRTIYSVIVEPGKLKEALAIQAGMLENPSFDADALQREVPLVIEEEKMNAAWKFDARAINSQILATGYDYDRAARDEQSTYALARLYNIAFAGSQAGRWKPAGADALRSITGEQLAEFYRARYRPDNLIVTVVGDVSTFNTLVQVQQSLGDFGAVVKQKTEAPVSKTAGKVQKTGGASVTTTRPPTPDPRPAPAVPNSQPTADEQPKLRYGADRGDINQSIVSVGFRVPGFESKDWAAVETLAALIGQGRASLLNRSLVESQMVVSSVEADYLPLAGASALVVQMRIANDKQGASLIDKAESLLFTELDEVRREIPGEGEMARAKAVLEKRFVDERGTYAGRARGMALAEAARGGLGPAALDYLNQIRAVRAEDAQRVAAKYFTIENTAAHEYEPLTAAPRTFDAESFAKTVLTWSPGFAQSGDAIKARAADASAAMAVAPQGQERSQAQQVAMESLLPLPVKDYSTLNGPQAFVRESHSQPSVSVALLFQGGRDIEDESTSGTTELMLRSMLYGTPRRLPAQVAQEMDQLGADVEVVVEPDFFGFVLSVLSRNADRALKILRDMTEDPAFRDDDVERARLAQIGSLRRSRDSSVERARELFNQAMWAGHAYSLPQHGRDEVVTKITADQLREWHARAVKRQLPLAVIVGDTNGSALVSSQLAEGFKRRELDKSLQIKVPQPKAGERTESRKREQTTAAIGFAGPKSDGADLAALELIEALMNRRGGRLLQELSDKQGLALRAQLDSEALFVGGTVYAEIVTAPENEQRARAALLAELERVARGGTSADELNGARALAVAWKLALLQSQRERALEYARAAIYQRKAADVDALAERLSKVTADDIKRVASAYFKTSAATSGVVRGAGPPTSQPPQKQN